MFFERTYDEAKALAEMHIEEIRNDFRIANAMKKHGLLPEVRRVVAAVLALFR